MTTPTLRGYVWAFCLYLATTVKELSYHPTALSESHVSLPLFLTFFPSVIAPAVVIVFFLAMFREFNNPLIKTVLLFSAVPFALSILSALHHYSYISFTFPRWISTFFWLAATILLGYRTDQLLKQSSQEIEAN
jgi:ABC-type Na+ efflux pump permease subunit